MTKLAEMFVGVRNKVVFGFSTKADGNLSFKWPGKAVVENRQNFFCSRGLALDNLVMPEQIHSNRVFRAVLADQGRGARKKDWIPAVDGIVSAEMGIILGIETADCLPILAFDSEAGVAGAVHAGWRGAAAGMASSLVKEMSVLGAKANQTKFIIGPHIKKCCFEVGQEVAEKFHFFESCVISNKGKKFIDIEAVIRRQLTKLGASGQNIWCSPNCTCCSPHYYSYRREGNFCAGGMISFVSML